MNRWIANRSTSSFVVNDANPKVINALLIFEIFSPATNSVNICDYSHGVQQCRDLFGSTYCAPY
jgi:alpha-galactosidase/6-phospho-beta-glucosidase family protein